MISLKDLLSWQYFDGPVIVTLLDGHFLDCKIDNVDDEEESGLGEPGLSVFTKDGRYVGISQSEIQTITAKVRTLTKMEGL